MDETEKIFINPAYLTKRQSSILSQFLQYNLAKNVRIFPTGDFSPIAFTDHRNKVRKIAVTLSRCMVHRKKLNHQLIFGENSEIIWKEYHTNSFTVLGDAIRSKNDSRAIIDVACTHHLHPDMNLQTSFKPRVIKLIELHHRKSSNQPSLSTLAKNEAKISRMISYLHAKKLTVIKNVLGEKMLGFLVMRDLGFLTLEDILEKRIHQLTTDQTIRLAKNILRCLKEEIHDKHIAHLDIKPSNIIVEFPSFDVKIIDFGLSTTFCNSTKGLHGTCGFLPPEACSLKYPLDDQSDLYSVAIVLWLLFSGSNIKDLVLKQRQAILNKHLPSPPNINFLFNQSNDLYPSQRLAIQTLLHIMFNVFPNYRASLEDGIALLNQIELERKLSWTFFEKNRRDILTAHQVALDTYTKLRKSLEENNRVEKMQPILLEALNLISDSPCSIKEFTDVLDIDSFRKLRSKRAIRDKLKLTIDNFFNHANRVVNLRCKMENYDETLTKLAFHSPVSDQLKSHFHILLAKIDNTLYKIDSFLYNKHLSLTLDNIVEFNLKMDWKNLFLEREITHFHKQLVSLVSCDNILQQVAPLRVAPEQKNDGVTLLKNRIRLAIKHYIDSTLTIENIAKQDRAASLRRRNNMREILAIVDHTHDPVFLLKEMKNKARQMNGFFGRSLLSKEIKRAISFPSNAYKFG